jgi:CRP-like cAMP-binding protein
MTSEIAFSGNLNFFGLGDLIQLVGSHGSTGILDIRCKYTTEPGKIFFIEGNPIDAVCGSKRGKDALYSLFGWTHGEFEFKMGTVSNKPVIEESRMQIILSGLKMLDDGEIEKLGPYTVDKKMLESMVMGIPQPLIKGPLIDYIYVVDEEAYEAGSDIVLEGRYGNWLWVILEGTVQIVKDTPGGKINIVRIGPGSFVGSIASFLLGDYVRSATVLAVERVLLGVLDSSRLVQEFGSLSLEIKKIFLSLDRRLKQVTDRSVDAYFKEDPKIDFNNLDAYITQGKDNGKLAVIREGMAFVVRKTKSGDALLANLSPGDFIGCIPFIEMNHEPFSASVYGTRDLIVDEVNLQEMVAEYQQLSPTFKNIINNIAAGISATSLMICEFLKQHTKK